MKHLEDNFGRKFPYIRMSITEVCNFKCGYCLPNGYQADKSDNRKFLNIDEIRRLAKGFSELGVKKIRLTGGEPTVRKDFYEIVKILKNETSIEKIVITTNGYHLDQKAKLLIDSGLNGINISIDSLDRETFKNITKHDRLPEILKGIEILQSLNFDNIKINADDIAKEDFFAASRLSLVDEFVGMVRVCVCFQLLPCVSVVGSGLFGSCTYRWNWRGPGKRGGNRFCSSAVKVMVLCRGVYKGCFVYRRICKPER